LIRAVWAGIVLVVSVVLIGIVLVGVVIVGGVG